MGRWGRGLAAWDSRVGKPRGKARGKRPSEVLVAALLGMTRAWSVPCWGTR
eukprot:CAMPEP_0174726886 /NCGR_PEP_ID=MMETSP1094-20130205/48643_1 /TAXON_ID=156173 /ORGANISM="Chrysochromulina brevifilum, Strain UTEX LB 985" /LENGTH=50 /DNA_ID=CAMNT_0015928513 /DNA_START=150 /DNA_END=299 /DNA_ORIENTATION=+